MSVETYVKRVRDRLIIEKKANHKAMDAGKPPDEYMKLVGRNAMIDKTADILNESLKDLGDTD